MAEEGTQSGRGGHPEWHARAPRRRPPGAALPLSPWGALGGASGGVLWARRCLGRLGLELVSLGRLELVRHPRHPRVSAVGARRTRSVGRPMARATVWRVGRPMARATVWPARPAGRQMTG